MNANYIASSQRARSYELNGAYHQASIWWLRASKQARRKENVAWCAARSHRCATLNTQTAQ